MANKSIDDELFEFKQVLLQSRNYYSHLLGRYKCWQVALWIVEILAGVLVVQSRYDINRLWARLVLLLGIVVPTLKGINVLPQRIKDLKWQYRQCENFLNEIEAEIDLNKDFVSRLKKKFAEVEKKDEPTNQCLMALCTNEAYLSLGIPMRYQLSWIERCVGIYCSWIKYDNHAKRVVIKQEIEES